MHCVIKTHQFHRICAVEDVKQPHNTPTPHTTNNPPKKKLPLTLPPWPQLICNRRPSVSVKVRVDTFDSSPSLNEAIPQMFKQRVKIVTLHRVWTENAQLLMAAAALGAISRPASSLPQLRSHANHYRMPRNFRLNLRTRVGNWVWN